MGDFSADNNMNIIIFGRERLLTFLINDWHIFKMSYESTLAIINSILINLDIVIKNCFSWF